MTETRTDPIVVRCDRLQLVLDAAARELFPNDITVAYVELDHDAARLAYELLVDAIAMQYELAQAAIAGTE